jgi:hypothetical protein
MERNRSRTLRSRAFGSALFLGLALCACDPVGEPITRRVHPSNAGAVITPDAGEGRLNCDQSARLPGTVALYCFEEEGPADRVADSTGDHHGDVVGTKVRRVRGAYGLGMALRFSDTNFSSYLELPDSDDWDLEKGSISLWLRLDTCPNDGQGIISRDARHQNEPGHIGIRLLPGCEWSVLSEGSEDRVEVDADEPLVPDRWSHIWVNFGAPALEIYLDARLVGRAPVQWGIAGNDNPWAVGADARGSDDGSAGPPADFLRGAEVDMVRIGSERGHFSELQ